MTRNASFIAVALACALAPTARADHVLLTDDLRFVRGKLLSIGPEALVYRDDAGEPRTLDAGACLGVFDPDVPVKRLSDAGVLTRADGQRLPGRPELRQGQLVWKHALLGHETQRH